MTTIRRTFTFALFTAAASLTAASPVSAFPREHTRWERIDDRRPEPAPQPVRQATPPAPEQTGTSRSAQTRRTADSGMKPRTVVMTGTEVVL